MDREMVWISEGYMLDDSGNLIVTTFIDLREKGERTAIPALVKGCKREHALEDGETILISKPVRFREYGEELILDVQEGLAKEESVIVREETASEARRRRSLADMNEAHELSNSTVRLVQTVTYSSSNTKSKNLAYGKEWWIFCTSMEPDDEDREAWRSTLPEEYDHLSEIGQPAKFAEALARMVTEQIGPQGGDGWLKQMTDGAEAGRTKHRSQWVIHGPVVYTDHVYDALVDDGDGIKWLAASIFTKSSKYAAQREYRFAVLCEGADEETVLLRISGMMRDAFKRIKGGLIRVAPLPAELAGEDQSKPSLRQGATQPPTHERKTITERLTEREEWHRETRTNGQVDSSEGERRERVEERIVTQEHQAGDDDDHLTGRMGRDDDVTTKESPESELGDDLGAPALELSEKEAVEEIALEEGDWNDGRLGDSFAIPVVHRGTGRTYKSFEDAFNDPAYPMSPMKTTSQEKRSSPDEIAKTYGAVETLVHKMANVREECRQDVASAGWYAMLCIRNIYAQLGDIVESVWIERERFVVIRLEESREPNATGRIVIGPSGAYAYCLQLPNQELSGYGGENWGTMFFPLGTDVENFKTFGWPGKES